MTRATSRVSGKPSTACSPTLRWRNGSASTRTKPRTATSLVTATSSTTPRSLPRSFRRARNEMPDELVHWTDEGAEMADSWLENLDLEICLEHLREGVVGRVGVVVDGYPIVLPVNYRLAETLGLTWVALRTRPGNVIDQASNRVAFEIDGIDATH